MLHADDMDFLTKHLPPLAGLAETDRAAIRTSGVRASFEKGAAILDRERECNGLILVKSGQLRASFELENGKELTLYRLLAGDVCILSASCVLKNITFEITLEAEKNSVVYFVPAVVWAELNGRNPAAKQFTMDLVAGRFSEVIWVMEQMATKNMGQRVAAFLLEQSVLDGTEQLSITHDTVAKNLGTAREVVSRVLKYMENDGLLALSRGKITLTQVKKLRELSR
ncbi:MAG: Crp/Fnr family transcriptional regulator [Ethanoligenens sp.]